jgi:polysaccharide biosynthesis protein PelG
MAGIGFELRKLFCEDQYFPCGTAALKSMLATSGPWVLAIVALLGVQFLQARVMTSQSYTVLLSVLVYSFIFSMILSSPWIQMAIRHVSDLIYLERMDQILPVFLAAVLVVGWSSMAICYGYLTYFSQLDTLIPVISIFFTSLSVLWLVMVFVSALRSVETVTFAFLAGMVTTLVGMYFFSQGEVAPSLMVFTAGINLSTFILCSRFLTEFGFTGGLDFQWIRRPSLYPLALSGFFFHLTVWTDKFLYWTHSPFGQEVIPGFYFFPEYDMAVFLGGLGLIPTIAYFSVFVETEFQQTQAAYLQSISSNGSLHELKESSEQVFGCFLRCLLQISIFQILISAALLILLPALLDYWGQQVLVLPILRITIINTALQILFQVGTVFLYYFDHQKEVLIITVMGSLLSLVITLNFLDSPYENTGYSYFLTLIILVAVTLLTAIHKLRHMRFYTFMGNEMDS